ncbi:hypothetical protein PG993_009334 [Apiospora rasikravindrae]|uniref:Methyltransferase domain-containing protein n=1 Tax=Apiospora rasikravindrae TaxID=990691 RepID=A0ABR1SKX3_9PEZI
MSLDILNPHVLLLSRPQSINVPNRQDLITRIPKSVSVRESNKGNAGGMPRLPPSLLQRARSISPDLATLLPACRDLDSARSELRWIRGHVSASASSSQRVATPRSAETQAENERCRHLHHERSKAAVSNLCRRRARGEPLQYLLGTQPFGPLEIQCRRGVLIPRPETEAWTYALASEVAARLASDTTSKAPKQQSLRIVDLCMGTGCIPLLLYALLHRRFQCQVWGFDVEECAVRLARENLRTPENGGGDVVRFEKADIFADDWIQSLLQQQQQQDERNSFNRDTGRSVRNFEPRLALVPHPRNEPAACAPEDVFYKRLCEVAGILRPTIMLFEVGDLEQATRVAQMALAATGERLKDLEIWRDCPDVAEEEGTGDSDTALTETYIEGRKVPIRGSGHALLYHILSYTLTPDTL